ncbi:MAG: hypothetical protein HY289_02870 [Planctomycetes bacterium]|nr:hypothetical protein [Planctomycetota bacterium]
MRARLILGTILMLVAPTIAAAQISARTDAEILAEAEAAFRKGAENKPRLLVANKHFANAADRYRELHQRGVRSPALYLSLGNAAVLADRWSEAIWAYQMGLMLDPNHTAMREHLAFVRAKVIYPPDGRGRLKPESWPTWLPRPSAFGWTLLFTLGYVLACVGITVAIMNQPIRATALTFLWVVLSVIDLPFAMLVHQPRIFALTALSILLAFASGVSLWKEDQQAEIDRRTPIVVVVDTSPLLRGNGISYEPHADIPVLPRGLEARLIHRRGAWLQIRLSTDEVGWVHRSQVLVVQ